ncbi:hypothetical protein [Streptomyces litchfieldiae]|uniref:SMI1/KNR4 family protein n=1 Tax=Streptomyces litchfieldiae TaxID=3075543 RepID=A0ABU2N292_9ACTN|nr:hypothetical protein [Streptomyces sp. DSM 44938]MDT0347638.1 hypothetical protein [Streptomyces sp. DSM 44938]
MAWAIAPVEAWRQVMTGYDPPDAIVDDTGAGYPAEVDRAWRALCQEKGLYAEGGQLLVTGAHPDIPWVLVTDDGIGDVAAHLADRPGEPDFLLAAPGGTGLCGVSTEEAGVLLFHRNVD